MKERRINGDEKGRFKLSNKYRHLINSTYPISHKCCEVIKKKPIKKYEKLTGKVVIEDGKYKTTKCSRTGCIACGFGVHLEKSPNRFERMKEDYPNQYSYYFNKLNYKEICDYIGIKY